MDNLVEDYRHTLAELLRDLEFMDTHIRGTGERRSRNGPPIDTTAETRARLVANVAEYERLIAEYSANA